MLIQVSGNTYLWLKNLWETLGEDFHCNANLILAQTSGVLLATFYVNLWADHLLKVREFWRSGPLSVPVPFPSSRCPPFLCSHFPHKFSLNPYFFHGSLPPSTTVRRQPPAWPAMKYVRHSSAVSQKASLIGRDRHARTRFITWANQYQNVVLHLFVSSKINVFSETGQGKPLCCFSWKTILCFLCFFERSFIFRRKTTSHVSQR